MEMVKPVADLIPQLSESEGQTISERSSTAKQPRLTERHIVELWVRMAEIYGHKWVSSYGDHDSGTWLKSLQYLKPDQLAKGLHRCIERSDPWPPSLPEFRALCYPTPAELGLPSEEQAFRDASNGKWEHGIVLAAANEVGTYAMRNHSESRTRAPFMKVYRELVREACEHGREFPAPEPRPALAHSRAADPKKAAEHINEIKTSLGD